MFKNILLVYSEKITEKHLSTVERIKNIVENEFDIDCCVLNAGNLNKDNFKGIDLVITAGGDGVFIRASHYLNKIPILGINSEPEFSEGFLTSLIDNELDALKDILKGKYKIIQRQRARIKKNNVFLDELVLNEVYVGSRIQFHTSRYVINLNGKKEEHRSSGVLVVTGSGSNAWYKSSGGKPFPYYEKKLKFLVREPYFGKLFQPKIIEGKIVEGEILIFEGKRHEGGVVAIDAYKEYEFNDGDVIEVELSNSPLNVIQR